MLFSLFLALSPLVSQQVRPAAADGVQGLVRVPAGALTLTTVNSLELDVASVLRTGEIDVIADGADRAALAREGIPFTVVHDDLAAFVYDRLKRRPMVLPVVVEV